MFLVILIQQQDLEKEQVASAELRVQSGQLKAIGVTVSRRMVREIERASSWNVPRLLQRYRWKFRQPSKHLRQGTLELRHGSNVWLC